MSATKTGFIQSLLQWFRGHRQPPIPEARKEDEGHFVFLRVPDNPEPLARGEIYEDPLDTLLREANIGEVTGGGSMLEDSGTDGEASIAWVGIDIELKDLDVGLPLLKDAMRKVGFPRQTILEYSRGNALVEDMLDP